MKRLALIAVLLAAALPAAAQSFTAVPYGGSIYGGLPTGYSFQYQNNSGDISDIARQQLQRFQPHSTTCTTYGNQTVCTGN